MDNQNAGPEILRGLDAAEAARRLQKYGPNALEEHKSSWLKVLLAFFNDIPIWPSPTTGPDGTGSFLNSCRVLSTACP